MFLRSSVTTACLKLSGGDLEMRPSEALNLSSMTALKNSFLLEDSLIVHVGDICWRRGCSAVKENTGIPLDV